MLTFEDYKPGHFATVGPRRVTRAELLAFAEEFDPQPMHLDEAAANSSMLKGMSGSGWHMCVLTNRMLLEGFIKDSLSITGLGIDELRWLAPLRPDDDVTLHIHIESVRPSTSRPDTRVVKLRSELFNASGQQLMVMFINILLRRRDGSAPTAAESGAS